MLFFREYWLNCFEESIENYVQYAIASQPTSDTAKDRAAMFKEKFISRVQLLKIKPLYVICNYFIYHTFLS